MRLWIKLAVLVVIMVEAQMALPVVWRGLGQVGDEIAYSYALRFGTEEDQVRVLERIALRAGFRAADEPWDEENVRWLAAVRRDERTGSAARSCTPEPEPEPEPVAAPFGPVTGGNEGSVASAAP